MSAAPFAPLDPSGKLPPGVSADLVGRVYRQYRKDLSPKKVLATLGVTAGLTGRAEQLRAALDDPAARAALTARDEIVRPAFHEAVYQWLRATPVGEQVHDLAIHRAVRLEDDRAFLDPARFAEEVGKHRERLATPADPIAPLSEAEALALYSLAFGLLQAADAAALVATVTELGPGFRAWFGVGGAAG